MRVGAGVSGGKTKRIKKIKREIQGEERERERGKGRKTNCSSFDLRHSDGRSPSGQELKFVYLTRAMLQEVGILHT